MKTKLQTEDSRLLEVTEYGRRRLLTYADSFRELARTMDGSFAITEDEENRESVLEARHFWDSQQLLCGNLKEMARIMDKVASEVFRLRPLEEKIRRTVIHGMRQEGIIVTDIYYIERPGERTAIGMSMYTRRDHGCSSEQAADMLSVLLNKRLEVSVASPYQIDEETRSFVFVEESAYVVLSGVAKAVKEEETISGDNYSIIESEKGKLTVLLSDGMGSGEKASRDSTWILDLMEKLIETGYSLEGSLKLINNALLSRPDKQNMSTLDLCDLDLYDGTCSFYKIGGAASFLKREHTVEQIESPSLPMGIFPIESPEVIRGKVQDGDYIVMMTDGVLDALGQNRYEETMRQIIESVKEQNPKEIARRILQFVLHLSGGRIQDDMTVIVLGIWENT